MKRVGILGVIVGACLMTPASADDQTYVRGQSNEVSRDGSSDQNGLLVWLTPEQARAQQENRGFAIPTPRPTAAAQAASDAATSASRREWSTGVYR